MISRRIIIFLLSKARQYFTARPSPINSNQERNKKSADLQEAGVLKNYIDYTGR